MESAEDMRTRVPAIVCISERESLLVIVVVESGKSQVCCKPNIASVASRLARSICFAVLKK